MVARLDDVRVEPQAVAVRRRDELDLLDVEAELVEPAQALVDAVALVGAERLLARQLATRAPRSARTLVGGLVGIEAGGQADLGVDVEQLADDVLLGDLEVVARAGRR